jgi:murein DD-endopeptidase MepM/ murein hydrolase activator NlpD
MNSIKIKPIASRRLLGLAAAVTMLLSVSCNVSTPTQLESTADTQGSARTSGSKTWCSPVGKQLRVAQGGFGSGAHITHKGRMRNAVDYILDTAPYKQTFGAPVYAMAEGKVVSLNDRFQDHDLSSETQWNPPKLMAGESTEDFMRRQNAYVNQFGANMTRKLNQRLADISRVNTLIILHTNGMRTMYMHLLKGSASRHGLTVGSVIRRGQRVGQIGYNGYTSGPHLHVEVLGAASNATEMTESLPFDVTTGCQFE